MNTEKQLKIPYVHWSEIPWKLRLKFAESIQNLDFFCKIVIYKNPIIQENSLENFLPKVILVYENIPKIIIDGNKGRDY